MNALRGLLLIGIALALSAAPALAQSDALNLPTDLYVLQNDGVVQRYGVGSGGVVDVTPADAFVVDFGISPDGARIAYRTQAGLFVANLSDTTAASPVDVAAGVPPLRGRGETIVWSSIGDTIAYTTQAGARIYFTSGALVDLPQPGLQGLGWSPDGTFLLAEAQDDIWWVYRRAGTALVLTAALPSSVGTAWASPAELAFAPQDGGLLIMNLNNRNAQTSLLDAGSVVQLPALAPDGRLLFFRRLKSDTATPAGYGKLAAITQGTATAQDVGTTFIDLGGGLRWTPGAKLMLAFQGGVLALFDPSTGQGFPLPISGAVAYAWGPYPPPNQPEATATDEAIFPTEFPTLSPEVTLDALTPEASATPG